MLAASVKTQRLSQELVQVVLSPLTKRVVLYGVNFTVKLADLALLPNPVAP